jgi:hypothetical protein
VATAIATIIILFANALNSGKLWAFGYFGGFGALARKLPIKKSPGGDTDRGEQSEKDNNKHD